MRRISVRRPPRRTLLELVAVDNYSKDLVPTPSHPRLAVVALCFGGLTASLTQTLVIPIQGDLPRLLSADPADTAWVVTVTLLAAAVAMPVTGRLADLYGKQRLLMACSTILVLGSVVCALSSTLVPMLAGRALQGLAMGFIPVGISLMREITPPDLAGSATAAMSATLGVGGAIGLPLSAWIVEAGDWHVLFWVASALSALVLVATWYVVPHVHDAQPGRLDVVGAAGLVLGLVPLMIGISKGSTWGWSDPLTLGSIAGGLVVLGVWGRFELGHSDPLVDLRTSAQRTVLLTNLAAVAIGFGMMAQAIVVPQLLAAPAATGYGLGQTLVEVGLWMAPGGLMMLLFAPLSGRMMRTVGARTTLVVGAIVLGGGYVVALFLMHAPWQLLVASCISSAGVGIGYAAMPTLILESVPLREAASAVGLNALGRSFGTTLAAAVMGTLLTSHTQPLGAFEVPTEGAFRLCFAAGALAAFAAAAIAFGAVTREPEQERVEVASG